MAPAKLVAMQLRLHSRYQNSAGQRVRIVLNLKRIGYEYVPVPSASSPAYRAINPQGLMPALEIDGRIVAQSLAIIGLVDELYPDPPLLPADPFDRAEARAFALLIAADVHPINNNRVRKYLAGPIGASEAAIDGWYRHWIATAFESLETALARRTRPTRYGFTETPGLAEACLVPQMANARRFGCDLAPYPRLEALDASCRDLPEFVAARPEMQVDYPG
ncbi:maleylacetoacetate isomerase [Devosia sp. Root413D1]|uniref:maleylacetoacetate isomerase n=2 Tax=unclassified Devosia TaxID=196773 RepID=UPI001FCD0A6F|nr:maleylacetoacetate isomerase [Devosia sp. Root413D1]